MDVVACQWLSSESALKSLPASFPPLYRSSEVECCALPLPPYSASLRQVGAKAAVKDGAATAQRPVLEGPASFRHAFPKQTRLVPLAAR
ncbi:hypothetical protein [Brucella intermedia]|uniref:hypothetical protein n=1 Tax=Brucella intermedia TaxID=94625 RepID=UPI002248F9B8|nr:hypothetical protein [Brucella intermedia]